VGAAAREAAGRGYGLRGAVAQSNHEQHHERHNADDPPEFLPAPAFARTTSRYVVVKSWGVHALSIHKPTMRRAPVECNHARVITLTIAARDS
jgi:hypothetical protein